MHRQQQTHTNGPDFDALAPVLESLAQQVGANPATLEGRLITDMLKTVLKLVPEGRHAGEIKLLNSALKELRYAYGVFAEYREISKISVFGSARTPEEHPDYETAVVFSRLMADRGWMVITGAGDGIMKAGHEGPGREASFGVAIRLPFETTANTIITGDEKLIHFRYFFTRKLIFVSQSNAVALLPGGFGTQDENFETLTLVQTGKGQTIPVVMLEGGAEGARTPGGYWDHWLRFVREGPLRSGWIDPEDMNLFYLARSPQDAADHISKFYRNYHSSRYVREQLVLRLRGWLSAGDVERLNDGFADIVETGRIVQRPAFDVEDDYLDMPRLAFHHTRRKWGRVRSLIDAINDCETGQSP